MSTPQGTAAPAAAEDTSSTSVGDTELSGDAADTSVDAADATTDQLEEVVDSEDATAEEKAEAKVELKRRMKFKVNGRDVEREIDLSDEKSLQELLQKGFAADERFQSASAMEKKMNEFAKILQMSPMEALIAAGHDPDKLTEEYMEKRVKELSKSPEQLQLEKLQKEIETERKKREDLEKEKSDAEQAKHEAEFSRQLDEEISSALSTSELPKSPYVVKRIAENLMIGIEQGHDDITVADVLPLVEKQIKEEIREMFEAMPEDIVEKVLGDNTSTRLRKRRIAKAKTVPDTAAAVKATGASETAKIKAEKQSEGPKAVKAKDFFSKF